MQLRIRKIENDRLGFKHAKSEKAWFEYFLNEKSNWQPVPEFHIKLSKEISEKTNNIKPEVS